MNHRKTDDDGIIIRRVLPWLKIVSTALVVLGAIIAAAVKFNLMRSDVHELKTETMKNTEMNLRQEKSLSTIEEYIRGNERNIAEIGKKIDYLIELHIVKPQAPSQFPVAADTKKENVKTSFPVH